MWLAGGFLAGAGAAALAWRLGSLGLANVSWSASSLTLYLFLALSASTGFLAGAAVCRRARYTREHLPAFSALAGGVAGGVIGAGYALTLTIAYMGSYATWPQDRLDQVLLVVSYPAFGGLGFCVGALGGLFLGVFAGVLLKLATLRRSSDPFF